MKIVTIIPTYNHYDLLQRRLQELLAHLPKDDNHLVLVVDDHSPDADVQGGVGWWQQEGLFGQRLKYFRCKENLGFGGTCNKGAKIAINNSADVLVFLSTDVTVMSNYAENVASLVALDKNILIGGELLYNDTGWNVLDKTCAVPYANGWFLAAHVDTWQKMGGFDPAYGKFDAEDLDLSTTAHWLGIKLVPVSAKLRHAGGQTINGLYPNRSSFTIKNIAYWNSKWKDRALTLKQKIYGIETGNP